MGIFSSMGLSSGDVDYHAKRLKEKADQLVGNLALYKQKSTSRNRDAYGALESMKDCFSVLFDIIEELEKEALGLERDLDYLRKAAKRELKGQPGVMNRIADLELELRNNIAKVLKLSLLMKDKA